MEFKNILKELKFNDEDLSVIDEAQKADSTDEQKEAAKNLVGSKLAFIQSQAIEAKKPELLESWKNEYGKQLATNTYAPLNNQLKEGIGIFYTQEEHDNMSTKERMKAFKEGALKLKEDLDLKSSEDIDGKLKDMQAKLLAEQKSKQDALNSIVAKEKEWEEKYKQVELDYAKREEQKEIEKTLEAHAANKEKYSFADEFQTHTILTLAKSHAIQRGIVFEKNDSGIFVPRTKDGIYPTRLDGTNNIETMEQFYDEVGKHNNLFKQRRTHTPNKNVTIIGNEEVELKGASFLRDQFAKENKSVN